MSCRLRCHSSWPNSIPFISEHHSQLSRFSPQTVLLPPGGFPVNNLSEKILCSQMLWGNLYAISCAKQGNILVQVIAERISWVNSIIKFRKVENYSTNFISLMLSNQI